MLSREGIIPEPPAIVQEQDAAFDVVYLGALSRAQRVDEATSIDRWVNSAAMIAEMFPDGLDVVDIDEALRHSGRSLNIPAGIIRSEGDVKKLRKDRDTKRAAMEEAAVEQAQGEAAQATGAAQESLGDPNVQQG